MQEPTQKSSTGAPNPAPTLREWYTALLDAYGPQHWWPADTATEVIIGAILTQNTAWRNVEKAIRRLSDAEALDFVVIDRMPVKKLAGLIQPAGTYHVKAKRLKTFARWLMDRHGGSISAALAGPVHRTRNELLSVNGIGPETADAILLYAASRPTFVVDAYTMRIFRRHHLTGVGATYADVKAICEKYLPADAGMFNEYHALLVALGKQHCRTRANCTGCPLEIWPHNPDA